MQTTQEIKERLLSYKNCVQTIKELKEQALKIRELATSITPKQGDGSVHTGTSDKVGQAVAMLTTIEDELANKINLLHEIKTDVVKLIELVNDDALKLLLIKRYMSNKTFEQIAYEMNYSYMHICRLHGRALQEIQKML
mgnify:CR=1 FL=1